MTPSALDFAVTLGAPKADFDGRKLTPMLCERSDGGPRVLGREGWLYELKLDGVRIVADKRADTVALTYRRSRDATASYPEIVDALARFAVDRLVLDGEIVAFDADGRPDFQRLGTRIQIAPKDARKAAARVPVAYVVFDVLAVGDRDVRGLPLEARKAILECVLDAAPAETKALVRLAPTFDSGVPLFALCREKRLEGVVAKRLGSTYRAGERLGDWLKIKCEREADFVVVGWAEGEGRRSQLGALDLAAWENGRFVVRGAVGSGLDEDTIERLLDALRPLVVDKPMATGKWNAKKSRFFVRPEVVVSVTYMSFSTDGSLKHPVFRGIRPDLAPEDCTIEASGESPEGRRIHLTSPEKPAAPDGTTRLALCNHYEAIASRLLPILAGRPCIFVEGSGERPLWPLPSWTPAWVRTSALPGLGGREARGVMIDDVDTLVFGVESGATSLLVLPHHEDAKGTADFVVLRSTPQGAAAVLAQARAARLPACVRVANRGVVEIAVALGRAPIAVAEALGPLLARLASEASGDAVAVASMAVAPFASILDPEERMRVTVAVEDGEAVAVAWGAAGEASDCFARILETPVDLDVTVAFIERALRS